MSQYTHIFLEKQNTFIEVSCTCRGCALSEMFDEYAPWEKVREVTYEDLQHIYGEYEGHLKEWHEYLDKLNDRAKLIATFNNSVEEKMDALHDIDESRDEVRETVSELESALHLVGVLKDVLHAAQMNSEYEETAPVHVYAGCECGSNVTFKDVEGYVETDLKPTDTNMFDGDQCWDEATKV